MIGTIVWKAVDHLRNGKGAKPLIGAMESSDIGKSHSKQPEPATLTWQNVKCSLADGKSGGSRELLSLDGGCSKPGALLAIMGPSGSGALLTSALPLKSFNRTTGPFAVPRTNHLNGGLHRMPEVHLPGGMCQPLWTWQTVSGMCTW